MKSYDETVSAVFDRMNAYKMAQTRRRSILLRTAAALGCICLIALLGFTLLPGSPDAPQPGSLNTPTSTTPPDIIQDDILCWENTVVINPIEISHSADSYICLLIEDFVPMTNKELNTYFGIDIFPEVPADLGAEWSDREGTPRGIYKRDGGTGEVYHDCQVLNWSNEDFTRTVNIELWRDGIPPVCDVIVVFDSDCEKSLIKNVPVSIGQSEAGLYLVEFIYKDVGFRMIIEGLSQNELVAIIESLIS